MDALVCLAALVIGVAISAKWKPQNELANARMSLRAPSPGRFGPTSPAQFFESIRQSPKPPSRVPPPIVQLSDDPAADLRYVPEEEVPLWFARWLKVDSQAAINWLAALNSIDQAAALVPMVIVKFYPDDPLAFLASLDDRWSANSRWGAIRGLAEWCGDGRHRHIDAIYRAVRQNERRSFLVRLSFQEPSHEFVKWMEDNGIPDDDGYLTRRVLDGLMTVYSDYPRSTGWRQRSEDFISKLAGTQAQERYRDAMEQIAIDDERQVANGALLHLLHADFAEGHRQLVDFRNRWEEEMQLSNPEDSENEGPPIMKDLAHFAYKYEASHDAAFRRALRAHQIGKSSFDHAILAYQESIAPAAPELREKLMKQLVSILVQDDPDAGIEAALRVAGVDAVSRWITKDAVHEWPNGLDVIRALHTHGVWSATDAQITTLREITNLDFQWNESATLEILTSFPDGDARRKSREMVRELLIDAGRFVEAEEMR